LLHTLGVQDHWKAENGGKRVFLLTRSAFLGQQRVGATVWSGDVYTSYWALSHQVPAGLNFALSGYPYWTTDIGGYWPAFPGVIEQPAYQELYARWFEFGTFCPIFRTHGHRPNNELWTYDKVEPTLIRYDKLRYRLMPYIYSLAWKVTNEDYTIQRPLVMDFRSDEKTWNIGDEFMFGSAILVNPVLKADVTHRGVCPHRPHGTTSGPERRRPADRKSKRKRRLIACRSTCAPDPSFRWDRRLNTPRRIPAAPSNSAFIAEPTANSTCTTMRATATTTRRASIP
jgi:alpha-D-xyloside xylohydrolase